MWLFVSVLCPSASLNSIISPRAFCEDFVRWMIMNAKNKNSLFPPFNFLSN